MTLAAPRVGAGRTLTLLKGKYARGHRVPGACPIVSINHLGVHLAAHVAWKEGFLTYAATSTAGCIILCGDAEGFSEWAKSEACKAEVKDMPDGRLFALIDGYLVGVEAQANKASATVFDGSIGPSTSSPSSRVSSFISNCGTGCVLQNLCSFFAGSLS